MPTVLVTDQHIVACMIVSFCQAISISIAIYLSLINLISLYLLRDSDRADTIITLLHHTTEIFLSSSLSTECLRDRRKRDRESLTTLIFDCNSASQAILLSLFLFYLFLDVIVKSLTFKRSLILLSI